MARVISIHEYDLKPGVDLAAFERAIRDAERRGLFGLAGLVEHHFLRGIKGARRDAYSAVWVFESREVGEKLWGSPEAPRPLAEYPKEWAVWENDILAPFPVRHPDTIRFTSYEELGNPTEVARELKGGSLVSFGQDDTPGVVKLGNVSVGIVTGSTLPLAYSRTLA